MKIKHIIQSQNRKHNVAIRLGRLCLIACAAASSLTACSDFFDQESDHVIYADNAALDSPEDSLYSVLGVVNKMQALADRVILLGEMRGDLSDVTSSTESDLRDVAMFNVGDANKYNAPTDYYAVINNCNFFLAHADTLLKNNQNEYIFRKEYAAVKAFRAWTYMQLAMNYGRVPFVTTPILTKDDAERNYETKNMQQICEYMLADLAPYADEKTPNYGAIHGVDSRMMFIPIHLLMADMNLWLGNYREAALQYYRYLSTWNGENSFSPIGVNMAKWHSSSWNSTSDSYSGIFETEELSSKSDIISLIPCDSIAAQGNYSRLNDLFNTKESNNYKASIQPSQSLVDLSAAQTYCFLTADLTPIYAPKDLEGLRNGDLRLSWIFSTLKLNQVGNGVFTMETGNYQSVAKYQTRNVHLYRRTAVYLRMAEALNRAGFPEFAFKILQKGVNNEVIENEIIPLYPNDADWLRQFNFLNTIYTIATNDNQEDSRNTIGIHSRGSGWSIYNEYYQMPTNDALSGDALLAWQIEKVEDLIMDEEALEFCFEGMRYYDLMRVALRRNDPAYLADRVYARRGAQEVQTMKDLIQKDLYNTNNWYLSWDGKIGPLE